MWHDGCDRLLRAADRVADSRHADVGHEAVGSALYTAASRGTRPGDVALHVAAVVRSLLQGDFPCLPGHPNMDDQLKPESTPLLYWLSILLYTCNEVQPQKSTFTRNEVHSSRTFEKVTKMFF